MKPARWVISGPWFTDRVWFVENKNASIHPQLTRKTFDTRAGARAYVQRMKGRRSPRPKKRTLSWRRQT